MLPALIDSGTDAYAFDDPTIAVCGQGFCWLLLSAGGNAACCRQHRRWNERCDEQGQL